MLDDPATLPAVREKMAGIDHFWLHAPFAELAPCAVDPLVREVTARRYRQALSAARQLGIRRLVIHSGYIPLVYFPEWFTEQSVAFWREFLPEVPEDMVLALENVMDETPQLMTDIVRQVDDPRLGLCLDVGHANTCASRTPPMEWIAPMAPYLRHVHLHNNLGDWDLHSSLGEGSIPMQQILAALLEQCPASMDHRKSGLRPVPCMAGAAGGYLSEVTYDRSGIEAVLRGRHRPGSGRSWTPPAAVRRSWPSPPAVWASWRTTPSGWRASPDRCAPHIEKCRVLVLAADNGVTAEGISSAPPTSVTLSRVINMTRHKTGMSALAYYFGNEVVVADMGIDTDRPIPGVLDRKVRRSTGNIAREPAMTRQQALQALETGMGLAAQAAADGVQALGIGEMGIGNTTTSAAVLAALTHARRRPSPVGAAG